MKNIEVVRIGIVGCGRVFGHYLKIFQNQDLVGYKIIAVCDIELEKSVDAANHFNAKSFTSLKQMLADISLDLLIVLTPSGFHYEHTKLAFDFGVNVLCEKPITMLLGQAEELVDIAKKANLMYGVAFQNRFNPAIRILEKAIKLGRFGKIVTSTIRLRWCRYQNYYEDGWHGTWLNDGGVINQQAIHHVDIMNWLMGPIESVCAASGNRVNKLEAEDTMVALVKFQNGALGTIEATTAARPVDFEASISIIGESGAVVIGGIALNNVETWNFIEEFPEDKEIKEIYSQEVPNGYGLSHKVILQSSIDSLLAGRIIPAVSGKEALSTTQLIHALYKSEEEGSWVYLDDKPVSTRLGL
jgi:UDP-N-acetyl-2-amino-2-deoxyglucuronate dehydrogenase